MTAEIPVVFEILTNLESSILIGHQVARPTIELERRWAAELSNRFENIPEDIIDQIPECDQFNLYTYINHLQFDVGDRTKTVTAECEIYLAALIRDYLLTKAEMQTYQIYRITMCNHDKAKTYR